MRNWKVKWIDLYTKAARHPFYKQHGFVEAESRKDAIAQMQARFSPPKYGSFTASVVR